MNAAPGSAQRGFPGDGAAPNIIKIQGHSTTAVQGMWGAFRTMPVIREIRRYAKNMPFGTSSWRPHRVQCDVRQTGAMRT